MVLRALAALAGVTLIAVNLAEFFVTFLLPRRVKRDVRLARGLYVLALRPWRALAARLSPRSADTLLGIFGPLGLIFTLVVWTLGLMLGFALLQYAAGSHVLAHGDATFWDDLYFSGGAFLSDSAAVSPQTAGAKTLMLVEAAAGFGVLFIVIGYLPALYEAFSRREVVVSQLDPRAGSPPSAGALLMRTAERGGWDQVADYLSEWDDWAAELMETHLAYPMLAWYRSQHVNQNWLAAMTTMLDVSAFTMAADPGRARHAAELTFAIGRHALADLAFTFAAEPELPPADRLPNDTLEELYDALVERDLPLPELELVDERLDQLRGTYERYAYPLSGRLVLPLPGWMPGEDADENWRSALWQTREVRSLP